MLRVLLKKKEKPLEVLCLGAHCDDIEIGCGGLVLSLFEQYSDLIMTWVVFASNTARATEFRASAKSFIGEDERHQVCVLSYRDGFLPDSWRKVKEEFESLKDSVSPDLILTHYREDLHQDHRIVSELTWNTFRDHLILEYEIPKYDGDLGRPNLYCELPEAVCQKKVQLILKHYQSQANKGWFSEDTFMGLMRLRGVEVNSEMRFAEGFYSRKMVF